MPFPTIPQSSHAARVGLWPHSGTGRTPGTGVLMLLLGVLGMFVCAIASCGPASPSEDQASKQSIESQRSTPPRMVVLSPALAVTMVDIGLEDVIVGRHGYDTVLRPSLPVCGDQAGIDYERLIETNPTHVLLEWGSRPLPTRLVALAETNGWELLNFTLLTLDDVAAAADNLYERFSTSTNTSANTSVSTEPAERTSGDPGHDLTAGSVADLDARFDPSGMPRAIAAELDRQRPGQRLADAFSMREDRPRFTGTVLLVAGVAPVGVLGPGSAHQELLVSLGGTAAIPTGAPWITLDAEDLLTLAPEAIILVAPRTRDAPAWRQPPTTEQVRERLGQIGSLDLPAVRSGRLGIIDHPHALLPSTALIPVANAMRTLLEDWAE